MKLRSLLVMLLLLTGAVLFVACEGERGPAGKDGVDGKDGAKGDKGDTGERGPAGPPGAAGSDSDSAGDPRCDRTNGLDIGVGVPLIYGTDDDDVICAKNGNSEIRAKEGDDIVYAGGGADKLIGGDGDDTLYGEGGQDHFWIWEQKGANKYFGGEGRDTIYFHKDDPQSTIITRTILPTWQLQAGLYSHDDDSSPSSGITFDLSTGTFDGSSFSNRTGTFAFEGIEDVFGGKGGDTITGDDKDNYLFGYKGDDTLKGGAGDDVLYGERGNDIKDGGAGDDMLYAYNDTDTLTGGAGADTFVLEHWNTPGKHVIKDFNLDEDIIYLNGYPKTGESVRNITNSGANLLAGTTTFAVIHKDGSASPAHAGAIVAKKDEVIKFKNNPKIDRKTRTYTFTDD